MQSRMPSGRSWNDGLGKWRVASGAVEYGGTPPPTPANPPTHDRVQPAGHTADTLVVRPRTQPAFYGSPVVVVLGWWIGGFASLRWLGPVDAWDRFGRKHRILPAKGSPFGTVSLIAAHGLHFFVKYSDASLDSEAVMEGARGAVGSHVAHLASPMF